MHYEYAPLNEFTYFRTERTGWSLTDSGLEKRMTAVHFIQLCSIPNGSIDANRSLCSSHIIYRVEPKRWSEELADVAYIVTCSVHNAMSPRWRWPRDVDDRWGGHSRWTLVSRRWLFVQFRGTGHRSRTAVVSVAGRCSSWTTGQHHGAELRWADTGQRGSYVRLSVDGGGTRGQFDDAPAWLCFGRRRRSTTSCSVHFPSPRCTNQCLPQSNSDLRCRQRTITSAALLPRFDFELRFLAYLNMDAENFIVKVSNYIPRNCENVQGLKQGLFLYYTNCHKSCE